MHPIINQFIGLAKDFIQGKPLHPRSPKWHDVRNEFLKNNPKCAACNRTDFLQVHHIQTFKLHPELELDPSNLITLCEPPSQQHHCHLLIGHKGNWKNFNENVRSDAQNYQPKVN